DRASGIDFLRGGTIRGGRLIGRDVRLTPQRYEWVGEDEIEVRWQRGEHVAPMTTHVTPQIVRYKGGVDWDNLTLTRTSDGKVFRYRRDGDVYRGNVAPKKDL